jgi:uncharacterized membrane protein YeaQ/YmgE (transglycosylase-associated protein family)
MTTLEVVIFLLVGAVCAGIAQSILGVRTGLLGSIVIGWLGAFVGTWVARRTGIPELFVLRVGGAGLPIVWTIVGSFVLVAIVGLLRRAP